jgi:uncharacterized membrane protein YqjE
MAETRESIEEKSVPELVKQITAQSTELARKEIELAEAELAMKTKRAGLGAGMFGTAGVLGLFGLGSLTVAAILALVVADWAAALIVAGVYLGLAGITALFGGIQLRRAKPLAPEQAAESVKDDVEWVKAHAQRGRQ